MKVRTPKLRRRGGRFPSVKFSARLDAPLPAIDLATARRMLRAQMDTAATFAKALWYQRAQDLHIRHTGEYLRGIQAAVITVVRETETDEAITVHFEIRNEAPHASIVEVGHPAFHLPSAINWSGPNVKRGKSGPYLHIPFKHAAYQTPEQREKSGMTIGTLKTMLPQDVYQRAKRLRYTLPKRVGPIYRHADGTLLHGEQWKEAARANPLQHQFVAADRYQRGGSLKDNTAGPRIVGHPGGALVDVWRGERTVQGRSAQGQRLTNPAWKTSRFQGLIKSGPKGHASYLTIRTITPRSPGWNIPAQMGHGVARQVQRAPTNGVGSDRLRELLTAAAVAAVRG